MKKLLSFVLLILVFTVPTAFAAPPAQTDDGEEYVVQANDWLSKLALKYYGDMFAYDQIVIATNAKAADDDSFAVIDNPDAIEVGQKLWIPAMNVGGAAVDLTLDMLKNAQYTGIYDTAIQLTDGYYEGEPFVEGAAMRPRVTFVDFYAFGDLNGDGVDDAVVFLAENSGGSGSFTYAAAVENRQGLPVNIGTELLGDRGNLISVKIEDGKISVDMITQGPDDPMCCASLEVVKSFELQDGELVELPVEEIGTISMARLDGTTWILDSYGDFNAPTPVLADTEISIIFDAVAGKIAGSAGCNNYFASYIEGADRALSIGTVGATMMACPEDVMAQEQKFLSALQTTNSFQFWNGKLMFPTDDGLFFFVPQE